MNPAILYLLPTPLGDVSQPWLLPQDIARIRPLRDFVVESEKTARRHLKALALDTPIQQLSLQLLNEHTPKARLPELLQPLLDGRSVALMSDAGCPAVADPGADLVALAHRKNITVMPLVGASSILLALMASGANGQQFAFHGYLPTDATERQGCLKTLQQQARQGQTQLFIETPYRNMAMLADAIDVLHEQTMLCVAVDLTLPSQMIISQSIGQWRQKRTDSPDLKKRLCLFVVF